MWLPRGGTATVTLSSTTTHVLNATHLELDNFFIESEQPLEAHLASDDSNGLFIRSENQNVWVESSVMGQELLELNGFIDDHTQVFKVFLITRDLADESLFYSLLHVTFFLKADGTVEFEYRSIFVPMMQFTYAVDGYEQRFLAVLVCEIMFAIMFACFALREFSQLISHRIVPWVQRLRASSGHG